LAKSPKPVRTVPKAEQRAETIALILDEAERLFAMHGFHGVTLKDVARAAGVHHTLLNYYFDDKQKLLDEVFARRAVVTRALRLESLNAYEKAAGENVTVEGALRAFLDVDLDLYNQGDDQWKNFGALVALVANTPEWGADLMTEHFDDLVLRLIGILKKALPGSTNQDIFWGYHFVSGALLLTLARTGRIDGLSGGICRSDDFEAIKARMATFMAAGLHEICGAAPSRSSGQDQPAEPDSISAESNPRAEGDGGLAGDRLLADSGLHDHR
jgi:AcrR family transcriptional regulator